MSQVLGYAQPSQLALGRHWARGPAPLPARRRESWSGRRRSRHRHSLPLADTVGRCERAWSWVGAAVTVSPWPTLWVPCPWRTLWQSLGALRQVVLLLLQLLLLHCLQCAHNGCCGLPHCLMCGCSCFLSCCYTACALTLAVCGRGPLFAVYWKLGSEINL